MVEFIYLGTGFNEKQPDTNNEVKRRVGPNYGHKNRWRHAWEMEEQTAPNTIGEKTFSYQVDIELRSREIDLAKVSARRDL